MQETIIRFVRDFSLDNVPEEIKERAVRAFTDTVAVILAGSSMDQLQCAARALDIDLAKPAPAREPTILGYGHRQATLTDAVLLNAVAAHSCEFNDLFYGLPGHPSAVLVPVVLGLGERLLKSGREVLEAYICGFEILGRVNEALMPKHHIKGFHSTSTAGIIGAAMAAGKLMDMGEEQLMAACSMACTFACGLRGNFGYTGNSLHVGNAAANGLRAALYAASGIKARTHLLDLPDGYLHAFEGNRRKLDTLLGLLGKQSVLESPGLLIKKYPTCFSTYQAIDAARMLVSEHRIRPEDIEHIECLTSPAHYMSLPCEWTDSVYGQRFCVPFCVCWVLSGGAVTAEAFSEAHYQETALLKLKARLIYGEDPGQCGEKGFGSTLLRLRVKGKGLLEYRAYPNPDERVENWKETKLKEKFYHCCRPSLNLDRTEGLWNACCRLDEIDDIAMWLDQWSERTKI